MNQYKRSVGLFYSRDEAEVALRALKDDGFDMNRVNIIAKDADQVAQSVGIDSADNHDNNAVEGASAGATSGAVLGGITGLLVGLGTLIIPGVGPILVAGEAATAIATALAGAGIGAAAGGIVGGLIGMGIPEDHAKTYSDRVGSGSYLVMVNGTNDDISRAESILRRSGIEEYNVYDANDLTDDSYHRTATSVKTVDDLNHGQVIKPTSTDKVVSNRTDSTKPIIATSDRSTSDSDRDTIIIEPRD